MKERPILFNGEMIRALLDGRKTQTRRIVKGLSDHIRWHPVQLNRNQGWEDEHGRPINCPYGICGDRLWVRETWQHENHPYPPDKDCAVFYRADYHDDPHGPDGEKSPEGKYRSWRPSIHMPRWASRILLEVTDVRVERLQDISFEDAKAEGAIASANIAPCLEHRYAFEDFLWGRINGPGSWESNPWVWVISFKVVEVKG